MIMRCKITIKCMFLVKFFHIPLKPLKKLLSSIKLSRIGRKSVIDKFFRPYNTGDSFIFKTDNLNHIQINNYLCIKWLVFKFDNIIYINT